MTQNQIAYQQLQEAQRHNKVDEAYNIARTALAPITSLISAVVPGGKYILGGKKDGQRSQVSGQTRLW